MTTLAIGRLVNRLSGSDPEPIWAAAPVLDQAARAFKWSARNPKPGSMRDGDCLVGMGCATAIYPTNVAAATARVRLRSDGQVLVQSASQEIGTGIRTVAGQMAAEQLPGTEELQLAVRPRRQAGRLVVVRGVEVDDLRRDLTSVHLSILTVRRRPPHPVFRARAGSSPLWPCPIRPSISRAWPRFNGRHYSVKN